MSIDYAEIKFKAWQSDTKDNPHTKDYKFHWKVQLGYQGHICTLDYWNHFYNPPLDKHSCVMDFLGDYICGTYNYEDFCNEFEYEVCKKSKDIWAKCRRTVTKLHKLFKYHNREEIRELYNLVLEMDDEIRPNQF